MLSDQPTIAKMTSLARTQMSSGNLTRCPNSTSYQTNMAGRRIQERANFRKTYFLPLFAATFVFFSSSCAQVPTRELSQYRQAFAEVQSASESMLIDYSDALEVSRKKTAAVAAATNQAPARYSTEILHLTDPLLGDIEVRRSTLRTIDTFNNVLVTLAEGKSVESVQATASGFIKAANNFASAAGSNAVPGLSSIIGGVQTLVAQMEKARLRKEFEKAVRDGAPIIIKMVNALNRDRQDHITLRANEASLRHVDLVNQITTQISAIKELIAARNAPASGDDPMTDIQTALNKTITPAANAFSFTLPVSLSYGPAATMDEMSAADTALMGQMIMQIGEGVSAYQSNVAQHESLRSALNNYGRLLRTMQSALQSLVHSLDTSKSLEDISDEILQVTFSLKKDIETYRAARKTAK